MPPRMPPRPGGPRLNIEALIAHHERPVSAAGGDRPQTAEHDASGLVDLPRRRGRVRSAAAASPPARVRAAFAPCAPLHARRDPCSF